MDKWSQLKKKKALQNNKQYKEPNKIQVDYDSKKPIFSFHHMRYGKAYCLSKIDHNDHSDLVLLLLELSQNTWDKIASVGRKSFGFEHMPKKKFNATVFPDIVTPDVDNMIVFTYSHGGRMAGIREDEVFHVIFVGDDLYPH